VLPCDIEGPSCAQICSGKGPCHSLGSGSIRTYSGPARSVVPCPSYPWISGWYLQLVVETIIEQCYRVEILCRCLLANIALSAVT